MKDGEKKNGFSLIELVISIAILVILTGLLAPQFMKYIEKSRQTKMMQKLENIYSTLQVACIEAMEQGKADTESGITIDMGKTSTGTASFETAVLSLLKESIGEDEMEHISILADTIPKGDVTEKEFDLTNVLIRYYPEPENQKMYYYFRKGYEEGSNWAAFCPGTFGEYGSNNGIAWK